MIIWLIINRVTNKTKAFTTFPKFVLDGCVLCIFYSVQYIHVCII